MGFRPPLSLFKTKVGHFLGTGNLPIFVAVPVADHPIQKMITKEDLLRDVLPANTILLQHGNISNLHRNVMTYYEDMWEDEDEDSTEDPCGVLCSSVSYTHL